ncbi:hypothetical protein KP509_05G039400 [Ceratopteris richardii]|uniref:NAC domain-containing protein n=1 Tax=Ceratopteris richardii TaxID=49495 RepID=A0A8T2UL33_CERRI|nr:hypothetical protein KP509_05G039400 [Ceratopteris richardii]
MDPPASSQPLRLPPGFRFHPTDEELVVHYLRKKASSNPLPAPIITEVDLYKFNPWELPEKATFGEEEWYFFSPRERKYPNGIRPNRAAASGYWKATGTDKPIFSTVKMDRNVKVGVKKALVFYQGRPPKGLKTNWIMHEYRLPPGSFCSQSSCSPLLVPNSSRKSLRLDDWVLCRIYKKTSHGATHEKHGKDVSEEDSSTYSIAKDESSPYNIIKEQMLHASYSQTSGLFSHELSPTGLSRPTTAHYTHEPLTKMEFDGVTAQELMIKNDDAHTSDLSTLYARGHVPTSSTNFSSCSTNFVVPFYSSANLHETYRYLDTQTVHDDNLSSLFTLPSDLPVDVDETCLRRQNSLLNLSSLFYKPCNQMERPNSQIHDPFQALWQAPLPQMSLRNKSRVVMPSSIV